MVHTLALILSLSAFPSPALPSAYVSATALAAPAPPSVDALATTAKDLYKERLDPAKARAAMTALSDWALADPSNPEPLVLEAHLLSFYVRYLGVTPTSKERLEHLERGRNLSKQASEMAPNNLEADFWAAVLLGNYSKEKGAFSSVSSYPEMHARMARVEKTDPSFFYGGIDRFWGRVIDQVPGSMRAIRGYDLEDAITYYETALKHTPHFLLTYIYLGECYLQMGDKEKAKAAFQKAAQGDINKLPDAIPENTIVAQWAKRRLQLEFSP